RLTLSALLDSPSLTGAYRFVVRPGEQTAVEVECRFFLRKEVRKLGIAPLTSMFFHGENTNRAFDDFRPEVHDSDGLLLSLASGEWLWRPLDNRRTLSVSRLRMEKPRGFGLLQRDRDFEHYQDLETHPERRASAWVEASGDWGAGSVELLEEHVVKNPFTGGWRLTFQARPKRREPLELRAFLEQGGDTLTETWSYVILP